MSDESLPASAQARSVPWSGAEMLLGILLAWVFWPSLIHEAVQLAGVRHWYYGGNAEELKNRLGLWTQTFVAPFQILTYPLLFAAFSRTRPEQLGLTTRRLGRNFLAGVVGLLLLAPAVFGILALVQWFYGQGDGRSVEHHNLEKIAPYLYPSEWVMLFFTATIRAPLHEELTFRGVLQPWLATRRWGGHAAVLGCLVWAVAVRGKDLLGAWPQGIAALLDAAAPALFVLAMLPPYLLLWGFSRTPVAPAIFGTSLLFACIHTSVWPTPIPLFALSLGLGILAWRSKSLVGPIVLHSLFNGYSCLHLLLG
jgi:membrane protease YdiL (CAAX protease family)